jgi:YggT family protein
MVFALFQIVDYLLRILGWVIIAQVILSWLVAFNVLNTSSQGLRAFMNALDRIMEPLYRPIRKILPDFGGLDFSPLVVLLIVWILRGRVIAPLIDSYRFQ